MEFLPTPQMPTGLAEMVAKLISERGGAWGALAQNLGQDIGGGLAARGEQMRGMISPELANRLIPPPGTLPPGTSGPQPAPLFNKPQPMTFVEQISKQREAESLNKMTTERMIGLQGIRGDQAAAKDHTSATDELLKNSPKLAKMGFQVGDQVPNRFISEQTTPPKASLGLRDEQFWQKQWVDTAKDMDLSKASSRTPLGVATTNNMKAGRALKLLDSNKTFTPQDMSLITTDLTAMMKGGSPDEELLRQQQYGNLQTSGVQLLQKILSKPENLNTPEVKQHLREIIKGIVEVDNGVIRGHIDNIESGRADVIAKRPKDWEKLKAKALSKIEDNKDSLDSLIDKYLGGQ